MHATVSTPSTAQTYTTPRVLGVALWFLPIFFTCTPGRKKKPMHATDSLKGGLPRPNILHRQIGRQAK